VLEYLLCTSFTLFVVGFAVRRTGHFLTAEALFSSLCGLYTLVFPVSVMLGLLGDDYTAQGLGRYYLAQAAGMLGVLTALSTTPARAENTPPGVEATCVKWPPVSVLPLVGVAICSLIMLWLLAERMGGISSFLVLGYGGDRYLAAQDMAFLGFGHEWMTVVVSGVAYIVVTRNYRGLSFYARAGMLLCSVAILAWLYVVLILGARGLLARVFLIVLNQGMMWRARKVRTVLVVVPILAVYLVLVMYGHTRPLFASEGIATGIRESVNMFQRNPGLVLPTAVGELTNPARALYDLANDTFHAPYWFGRSYFNVPLVFLPYGLFPNRPLTPGQWFVSVAEPAFSEAGGGLGFVTFAEGYLNFSYPGVFLQGLMLTLGISWISRRLRAATQYGTGNSFLIWNAIQGFVIMSAIRIDIAPILKTIVFGYLVPASLIANLDSVTRKGSRDVPGTHTLNGNDADRVTNSDLARLGNCQEGD